MLNAAVWLGATLFCSTAVLAALHSQDTVNLIGAKYVVQVASALTQIIFARLFQVQIACALVAGLHLFVEWLYLGRQPPRWQIALLTGLFALSLCGSLWLGPKLTHLLRTQYSPQVRTEERAVAEGAGHWWQRVLQTVNAFMIGGGIVYFWRVTRTDETPRVMRPFNFRV